MLKSKSNRLAVYDFKQSIIGLGWTFVWFLGITILIPNIFSLTFNGDVNFNLADIDFTIVAGFFLFIDALAFKYDNFKWTIQNGVSRRTAWWAKIKGTLLLSAVILLIDLVEKILQGKSLTNNVLTGAASHTFGAGIVNVLESYIGLLVIVTTGLEIGYAMALLSKRGKAIVIIGVPVALIVIVTYLVRALIHANIDWVGITNFVKTVLGYSDKTGTFSQFNFSIIMLVWILICTGLSYWFSQKMKLRRD